MFWYRIDTMITKEGLFRTICNASKLGTLGFFVGAGFSKAVLEGNPNYKSYKWRELLEACCVSLGIDESIINSQCSCPELATSICRKYSEINSKTYTEAVQIFKAKVCELTNSYPDQNQREKYAKWFKDILPSWIATTNYDTIIECILGGGALPISPNGFFCRINKMTPVFHLHGICNEPNEIVITNEDYVSMFRPNDYRQARLPFLMKESCVLMIGYGLGDINVITAVDWADNVYTNTNDSYDFPIIQLLFTENPKPNPYISEENVVILEIASIEAFFDELSCFMNSYMDEYNKKVGIIENNIRYFNNTEELNLQRFINNTDNHRGIILDFFKSLESEFSYVYNSFYPFLRVVLSKLDEMSKQPGNFEAYNLKLCILLEILKSIPVKKIPASLLVMIANELNSVGGYLNSEGTHIRGNSFSATDSWQRYKKQIPKDVIAELELFVNSNYYRYSWLRDMLKSID